jgi:hypothetical protein
VAIADAEGDEEDQQEGMEGSANLNERYLRRFPQPVRVGDLIGFHARLCPAGRAHAAGQNRAYRLVQPMVGLVRPAGCGADRSGRHRGPAIGIARHAAKRVRFGAELAECRRLAAPRRRKDQGRIGTELKN